MKANRRNVIKAAAAAFALPWLSSVNRIHAQTNGTQSPKRVLIFVDQYGRWGERTSSPITSAPWITDESSDYALSPDNLGWMLKPLENHINNLSVVSGVTMQSRQVLGGGISHAQVNSYTLTSSRVSGNIRGTTTCAHPSIHNFLGNELNAAATTKSIYNSLTFGTAGGYNYDTNGQQAPALTSPASIYSSAFGTSDTSGVSAQQAVIAQVQKQIAQIVPELAQANAATVMDAYRSSIDSIANELELRGSLSCGNTPDDVLNSGAGEEGNTQMFDAVYDVFACGLTPSIALGYTNTGARGHSFLTDLTLLDDTGAGFMANNYHRLSHRANDSAGVCQGLILRNQMTHIARLADRLAATPELDGSGSSMMDNTVIFYHQAMSSPVHLTTSPYYHFMLSGQNTNVQRGWHFECSDHSDNELWVTLAQAVGLPVSQFGGYQGEEYQGGSLNSGPISKILVETLGV